MAKKHHLPREAYADPEQRFLITTCVRDPQDKVFNNPALAALAVDVLRQQSKRYGVAVHVHVIMPDHVHLILQASLKCDLFNFMRFFKGGTTQRARNELKFYRAIWQPGFHDRRIRSEQHLLSRIAYVLHNPVRRKLVESWDQWKFKGSFVLDDDRLREIALAQLPSDIDNEYDDD
jgi:putative transposase